jgi:hypothetical protein
MIPIHGGLESTRDMTVNLQKESLPIVIDLSFFIRFPKYMFCWKKINTNIKPTLVELLPNTKISVPDLLSHFKVIVCHVQSSRSVSYKMRSLRNTGK